ncbi:MAG: S41 family peptidase [Aquificaceae bacterium]
MRSIYLLVFLFKFLYASQFCSIEEATQKLRDLAQRNYLWWDRVKDAQWKDPSEFIKVVRNAGDRWTSITKQEEDRLWYSSSKLFGLGIRWDETGKIVKVYPDSSAYSYGLRPGDIIISVNAITDKNLWRSTIRETQGPVKVEFIRDGLVYQLDIPKAEFTIPIVEETSVHRFGDKVVGYIKLNNFTAPAVESFRNALIQISQVNPSILILDLRDNGGGLISVASSIAQMMIKGEGTMFYLEGRDKNYGVYEFQGRQPIYTGQIAVLVNKQTASAAELLTSLLKYFAGAKVIGENTLGKHVGSNMYQLDNCGNIIRLITFQMKLPDGKPVATDRGIDPDCKFNQGKSPVEDGLECLLKDPAPSLANPLAPRVPAQ